jgi:hypothetical protein
VLNVKGTCPEAFKEKKEIFAVEKYKDALRGGD